jgi:hypothetical protein
MMISVFAALAPLSEDAKKALQSRSNRLYTSLPSYLASPLREYVEREHEGPIVAFNLDQLRGENGLLFGSDRVNHIQLLRSDVAARQFILSVDRATRSLTLKNLSVDRTKGAESKDVYVVSRGQTRTIHSMETVSIKSGDIVQVGDADAFRFRVHAHPRPKDVLLGYYIQDFIDDMPKARVGRASTLPKRPAGIPSMLLQALDNKAVLPAEEAATLSLSISHGDSAATCEGEARDKAKAEADAPSASSGTKRKLSDAEEESHVQAGIETKRTEEPVTKRSKSRHEGRVGGRSFLTRVALIGGGLFGVVQRFW